jgi:queuine tRNA-ribosyltransferase
MLSLMKAAHTAIVSDRYPAFLKSYFGTRYNNDRSQFPAWAITALRGVGVDLLDG